MISPRPLLAAFLTVTLVPAAGLVWLGWRTLEQDRFLEKQQVRDRLEHATDVIASDLQHELARIEESLSEPAAIATGSPAAVLRVKLDPTGVVWHHGAPLLYRPGTPVDAEPPSATWLAAEDLEFRQSDAAGAQASYEVLTNASDPRVRAGALVRLARVLRSRRQWDRALETYRRLAALDTVRVGGDPAPLVAAAARCRVLGELGRVQDRRLEAVRLHDEIYSGRWPLDRASFLLYRDEAQRWAGTEMVKAQDLVSLAEGVDWLWQSWQADGRTDRDWRGRRNVLIDGRAVLIVWRGEAGAVTAFAGSPEYVMNRLQPLWRGRDVLVTLVDGDGRLVAGARPSSGQPEAIRTAADARLPWTVRVTAARLDDIASAGAGRRRLLVWVLALSAFLLVAGVYFVARATRRELAVARLQTDFVSAVSHEFRTPLTSIGHLVELLKSGKPLAEERRAQYYEALGRETERLRRFVETLLDFGRLEAGAAIYHFESVDPNGLVRDIVDDFRSQASPARVIRLDGNGQLPPVRVDRQAFGLALRNLLDNAVKYSPDSEPVEVAVGRDGARVSVSVCDRGVGIPAGERRQVFRKFVRGASSQASGIKGTGVGLALAEQIVRAHHGDIRLDTEVGRGTTFTIVLPAADQRLHQ